MPRASTTRLDQACSLRRFLSNSARYMAMAHHFVTDMAPEHFSQCIIGKNLASYLVTCGLKKLDEERSSNSLSSFSSELLGLILTPALEGVSLDDSQGAPMEPPAVQMPQDVMDANPSWADDGASFQFMDPSDTIVNSILESPNASPRLPTIEEAPVKISDLPAHSGSSASGLTRPRAMRPKTPKAVKRPLSAASRRFSEPPQGVKKVSISPLQFTPVTGPALSQSYVGFLGETEGSVVSDANIGIRIMRWGLHDSILNGTDCVACDHIARYAWPTQSQPPHGSRLNKMMFFHQSMSEGNDDPSLAFERQSPDSWARSSSNYSLNLSRGTPLSEISDIDPAVE